MFDLADYQSYQDYFSLLATQHKQIDCPEPFLFGDTDVQSNEVKNWKGKKLWLWPYGVVRISDNTSDNYLRRKEGVLFVGGAVESKKFVNEHAHFKICEKIVADIISRMLFDRSENKLVTKLDGWSYQQSELITGSSKLIGCEFRFWFYEPGGFEYNVTQWDL